MVIGRLLPQLYTPSLPRSSNTVAMATAKMRLGASRLKGRATTHVWVVVHDQQVLRAALGARALVGGDKVGDVVVLQQRQPVDGALVVEVLPVGRGEHLHGHGPFVQRAAVHGAVSTAPDQLAGEGRGKK